MTNNQDRPVKPYQRDGVQTPGHLWTYDDGAHSEDRPADFAMSLASLGFILAALRRGLRLLSIMTLAGLLLGLAYLRLYPPQYQATTSVLLPVSENTQINDNQAIAQSRTVAGLAANTLGPPATAASLGNDYTVAVETDRVLLITSRAPSANEAVREANAVATAFLTLQAHLVQSQQQLVNSLLQQQITNAQQQINSISNQISRLSAQPPSPSQASDLDSLRKQRSHAISALTALQQAALNNQASSQVATDSVLKGSQVLDKASALPQHNKRRLAESLGVGLIAGLALGLGIIVVRALVSDRLRRRDEVARALTAPVKLSVDTGRLSRWPSRRRRLSNARSPAIQQMVAYLPSAVSPGSRGPASLAIVPVDDVQIPALCLFSFALAQAQQGIRVVIADLCSGSPAARLAGVTDPGVHEVTMLGVPLVVAIPERGDLMPTGPLQHRARQTQANEPLVTACASADLLLTLAVLDPSLGGEHLSGWTHGAVAVVTAGRSTAERIHAVGEMIRLAGIRLVSGVLVGADQADQSLGGVHPTDGLADAAAGNGRIAEARNFFVAVNGGPDDGLPVDQ